MWSSSSEESKVITSAFRFLLADNEEFSGLDLFLDAIMVDLRYALSLFIENLIHREGGLGCALLAVLVSLHIRVLPKK